MTFPPAALFMSRGTDFFYSFEKVVHPQNNNKFFKKLKKNQSFEPSHPVQKRAHADSITTAWMLTDKSSYFGILWEAVA